MIGVPGQPVRLLHVTDPHLFADESRTIYGVTTATSLRRVLDEAFCAGTPRPAAILVTGDIADDHAADTYANFQRELGRFGLPVFCLPGNHDAPARMTNMLNGAGFQYGGSATFGDWQAVFLDTHVDGRPEGRLRADELVRLDVELRRAGDRHVLVCLHHPPLAVGSAWLDHVGLRNAHDVLAVLDRHANVRAVLAGHVHQEFDAQRNDVRVLTTPSTCAQFTPRTDRCVMDLRPPGYRWLALQPDGAIQTEVVWLQNWVVTERPPDDRF
jgi:Icc protein